MYLLACGALLAIGLILNIGDRRMLVLTAMVGTGIFLPVPRESVEAFYGTCIGIEVAVALVAFFIRNKAGLLVFMVSALLVVTHMMGYSLDGSPPFSSYRILVKILEVSQLLACVALSSRVEPILRNHDA